jgi:serine/threonine-protein kinase
VHEANEALQPGTTWREFEILAELGPGLYQVLAPGFDKPMALKVVESIRRSEEMIKRAIREVAILRSLSASPHVATLHGSSIGADHFWVLMDWVEGAPRDRLHDFDSPMKVALALDVVLQVSMGLAEAHAQGVVHRDLNPANIWIQKDGTAKLLDFGLARAWGVPWAFGTNATAARGLVGSPHYCQPEQLHTDQLTPASDVYSLCTILYELLSARAVLFAGQTVGDVVAALGDNPLAWLDAHAMKSMVPITKHPGCGGLPDALVALLARGLAKDPRKRPQTGGELASALGTILVDDLDAMRPATVRVVAGADGPVDHALAPGRRTIGSAADADLRLDHPEVFEAHAIVDWSGALRPAHLRPASPRAELSHNGEPLRRAVAIEPGDLFGAGNCTFTFSFPE